MKKSCFEEYPPELLRLGVNTNTELDNRLPDQPPSDYQDRPFSLLTDLVQKCVFSRLLSALPPTTVCLLSDTINKTCRLYRGD